MAENKDKDIVMKCRHMEKVYPGTKALTMLTLTFTVEKLTYNRRERCR